MKKTIQGELYHEIEKLGNKKYRHVGFRDKANSFGDMMESIVPEVGMTKKVKLTIETIEK